MKPTWRYTFSFLFLMSMSLGGSAQAVFPPTVKTGIDLTKLGRTLFKEDYQELELKFDVDFTKFLVVGDYGISRIDHSDKNFDYGMQGNYYRLGLDYNLIGATWRENRIFTGVRYGWNNYNETMMVEVDQAPWGAATVAAGNENVNASWFEGVVGLKVNIVYNVMAGFTLRHKFRKSVRNQGDVRSYQVPGFGLNDETATWALNYYLLLRLDWNSWKQNNVKDKKE